MRDEPTKRYYKANITDLIPYANNARTHSDKQIKQIAGSLQKFGMIEPIIIDKGKGIIAGHGRVLAAERIGWTTIDALEVADMSDTDKQAYILASNRLAELAGWDKELLGIELKGLLEDDFDVELIGWDAKDLEGILPQDIGTGLTDEDETPELAPKRAELGELWVLGDHRLYVGDSTDSAAVSALLGDIKPHLMVTDPPYGVDYDPQWRAKAGVNKNKAKMGKITNDKRADWMDAWVLFPGHIAYVWHGGLHSSEVQASLENSGFAIRSQIIWSKDRFALSRGDYHWQHEPCWYAVKGKGDWHGDRAQSTIWNIKAREDSGHGHGSQKPVECMRRPMQNNSSQGQVVYDPFMGSGTSIIAAETIGRICYGLELNPEYADITIKRWEEFTGNIAEKANAEKEKSSRKAAA